MDKISKSNIDQNYNIGQRKKKAEKYTALKMSLIFSNMFLGCLLKVLPSKTETNNENIMVNNIQLVTSVNWL